MLKFVIGIGVYFSTAAAGIAAGLSAEEETRLSAMTAAVYQLCEDGKFPEAIPLAREDLELSEKAYGRDDAQTAKRINNLAAIYYYMGDYVKAEPLYQRALKINEEALGHDDPIVGVGLSNLAGLHRSLYI